jgi:hypothetical protein
VRQIPRERSELERSRLQASHMERPKNARTEADESPCAALWTTLSGFESPPPSQTSLASGELRLGRQKGGASFV